MYTDFIRLRKRRFKGVFHGGGRLRGKCAESNFEKKIFSIIQKKKKCSVSFFLSLRDNKLPNLNVNDKTS